MSEIAVYLSVVVREDGRVEYCNISEKGMGYATNSRTKSEGYWLDWKDSATLEEFIDTLRNKVKRIKDE